jgi:anti-sigma B factor antagonist
MLLSLDSRHCGTVYVIRCTGRIVAGEEVGVLEASITHGLREFIRIVLHCGDVSRVDSTGLGLLVRFLSHTRNHGGDFRLAALPPFMGNMLQMTKLDSLFRIYDSEEEAIVSFLQEPKASNPDASVGPVVLFVDQSPDLCAFVRTLLHHHGFEVLSTSRIHDAMTLLTAAKFDYIVLGPHSSHFSSDNVVGSLKTIAPAVATVLLESGFEHEDPEQAELELLQMMRDALKS